jgi:uncharacterized YkwD family protein/spore coat assembly protein SafA
MKKLLAIAAMLCVVFIIVVPQSVSGQTQTTHTVKSGDTLWKISVRYHVGLSEIIEANPQLENPDLIYPGDKITIPKNPEIKRIEHKVTQLTNQEREKRGLQPLRPSWELSRVARYKSRDMMDRGYFSHESPTYGSPFNMMRDFGIEFTAAGENIAAGQRTAKQVVQAWMDSPGHRKNILNENYTRIGVGYAKGGSKRYYWTQMFTRH